MSVHQCATGKDGKAMLEGEYRAMSEISKTTPALVPGPYGCGQFELDQVQVYFLLNEFIEVSKGLPDPVKLAKSLADLHCSSVSPTGSFGFSTNTCHGRITQQVAWDSSWSNFFSKLLQNALERNGETNGIWPMLEEVSSRTLYDVIPRLLGALEMGDHSVRPVLIHGDLWEGNILTERATRQIFLTDAASYYAHSEMELGMWRCQRHAIHDEKYKTAYLAQVPRSEPAEEWDDRNRLYCVKMNLIHSAHHQGVQERKTAFEDMCYLIDQYAPYDPSELRVDGFLERFVRAVVEAKKH